MKPGGPRAGPGAAPCREGLPPWTPLSGHRPGQSGSGTHPGPLCHFRSNSAPLHLRRKETVSSSERGTAEKAPGDPKPLRVFKRSRESWRAPPHEPGPWEPGCTRSPVRRAWAPKQQGLWVPWLPVYVCDHVCPHSKQKHEPRTSKTKRTFLSPITALEDTAPLSSQAQARRPLTLTESRREPALGGTGCVSYRPGLLAGAGAPSVTIPVFTKASGRAVHVGREAGRSKSQTHHGLGNSPCRFVLC